ncbi:hypothetical protein L1887_25329 [Cichorium endivia]|nr:hypothetical protein L1887_25329 [Cichorium endivia]
MHTFLSPKKVIFKNGNNLYNKDAEKFYTLFREDELALCLERGYIGTTTTITYPCSTPFRTLGLCNGTFCLKSEKGLSLWNPSIRRKLNVPECPGECELHLGGTGFGFDRMSDDYKIVCLSLTRHITFVYAVKTGTWCEIASLRPEFAHVLYEAVSLNGVLHWEVHYFNHLHSYILTFDLSSHVFGMIPLPAPTRRMLMILAFGYEEMLLGLWFLNWERVNFQLTELCSPIMCITREATLKSITVGGT